MANIVKWFLRIWFDQRGDVDPNANLDAGQGEVPADGGQGAEPPADDQAPGGQGGQGNEPPPPPKYGEFGDDPDKVWQAFTTLKGKTTATERNMASVRRQLQQLGVVVNEDGSIGMAESSAQKKSRFTDDHKKLFDAPVLEAIRGLVQDMFDEGLTGYTKQQQVRVQWSQQKNKANSEMVKLFPTIMEFDNDGEKNPNFNEALYNRATEIWENNPLYKKNPAGEKFAVMEAAIEIGISPIAISKAKKEGYQKGVEGKKVLGAVGGGGQGKSGFKKLSKEEFSKLSSEEKEKYQQEWIQQGGAK